MHNISYKDALKSAGGGTHSSNRIEYIDALKGFAILCVVLGHITGGYIGSNMYPEHIKLLIVLKNAIYMFHMPLFMMISGYVYYMAYFDENNIPNRKKMNRQIYNLMAVYLIFSVAVGIFKLIFSGSVVSAETVSIKAIFMIPIRPILGYWYLYVLIAEYLIFSIPVMKRMNKWTALIAVVLISLCSGFIGEGTWFCLRRIMYYTVFFYIGISYKKYGRWILNNVKIMIPALCLSLILIVLFRNVEEKAEVIEIIIAGGISLAVWYVFANISWLNNKVFRFLGQHCLEIYVIHNIFTAMLRTVFAKLNIDNIYVGMVATFVIATAGPILVSFVCQKLHIHGLLFKPATYVTNLKKEKT